MKMFDYSADNMFRHSSWYVLFLAVFFMLYTPEIWLLLKVHFSPNISKEWQTDGMLLCVLVYWALCFSVPYLVIKLIARYGDGVTDKNDS